MFTNNYIQEPSFAVIIKACVCGRWRRRKRKQAQQNKVNYIPKIKYLPLKQFEIVLPLCS